MIITQRDNRVNRKIQRTLINYLPFLNLIEFKQIFNIKIKNGGIIKTQK